MLMQANDTTAARDPVAKLRALRRAKEHDAALEEARSLYWHSEVQVTEIAKAMGIETNMVNRAVGPLKVACRNCSAAEAEVRSREDRRLGFNRRCPKCVAADNAARAREDAEREERRQRHDDRRRLEAEQLRARMKPYEDEARDRLPEVLEAIRDIEAEAGIDRVLISAICSCVSCEQLAEWVARRAASELFYASPASDDVKQGLLAKAYAALSGGPDVELTEALRRAIGHERADRIDGVVEDAWSDASLGTQVMHYAPELLE